MLTFNPNGANDYDLYDVYNLLKKRSNIDYTYDPQQKDYNIWISEYHSINYRNIGEHFKWESSTLHYFHPIEIDIQYNYELLEFIRDELPGLYEYINDNQEYTCKIGLSRELLKNYIETSDYVNEYSYRFHYDRDVTNLSALLYLIRKLVCSQYFSKYEDILVLHGKMLETYIKICELGLDRLLERSRRYYFNHPIIISINKIVPREHIQILKNTNEILIPLAVSELMDPNY